MRGELLWVYEGLTTYRGQVLAARSGLLTADEYRESLALTAAGMDHQRGRTWRPLLDTTLAAQILYGARGDRGAWRRGVDFYPEGELLWLEADALIRRESGGAKSLDDFCRLFYGGTSGPPQMVPYDFDDVVAALQKVAPHDWRGFWRSRVEETTTGAPLGGVTGGGWTLVYTDTVPQQLRSQEAGHEARGGERPSPVPGDPAAGHPRDEVSRSAAGAVDRERRVFRYPPAGVRRRRALPPARARPGPGGPPGRDHPAAGTRPPGRGGGDRHDDAVIAAHDASAESEADPQPDRLPRGSNVPRSRRASINWRNSEAENEATERPAPNSMASIASSHSHSRRAISSGSLILP